MASPSTFLRSLSVAASSTTPSVFSFNLPRTRFGPKALSVSGFSCQAGPTGFFTRLGRLIKEKTKSDVEKILSDFSKTRDNLAVIDELLLYWNLADTDRVLDGLEEVVGTSGLILRKLDGSARGGCVVSLVDELGIPAKFVGVGEGVEDLQPFDAGAFVNAIFS